MADESTTTEGKESEGKATDGATATVTPPDPDAAILEGAQNPDAVKRALGAERSRAKAAEDRAKAAEAEAQQFKDRDKSAQEKAEQRAAEAEKSATEAQQKLLRLEVGGTKSLPVEIAALLQGSTKEEMEAHADQLQKVVQAGATAPDLDGGARTSASSPNDMDALIRSQRR